MPQALVKQLAFSGKDYDQIVQALESPNQNFSEESIELIKDKINDYIVEYQLANQVRSKALNQLIIGGVFFMIGVIITGGSFSPVSGKYFLAYGAILAGAWNFKEGYKIYRLPLEELVPRRSRFRR